MRAGLATNFSSNEENVTWQNRNQNLHRAFRRRQRFPAAARRFQSDTFVSGVHVVIGSNALPLLPAALLPRAARTGLF
jgi:hypothetical protein